MKIDQLEKLFMAFLVTMIIMLILSFQVKDSEDMSIRHRQLQTRKNAILNSRSIHQFLKQLTRAQRFERNNDLREVMNHISTKLSKISRSQYAHKKNTASYDVTLLLNAVQEIKELDAVLTDLERKSSLEWVQSISIVVGLTNSTLKTHLKTLKRLKSKLPNMQWSVAPTDKLTKTLFHFLTTKVDTKYVLISRNLRHINDNFDMERFMKPLASNASDIIGGTSIYPDRTWNLGCYQSKLIWSQYKVQIGFDAMYGRDWVICDTIDGPFVTHKKLMLDFLMVAKSKH